jgi:hypothetical protein
MNRISWIIKEMYRDLIKNYKWVLKGVGIMMAMIAIMKVLVFFNLGELFLPIMLIIMPIAMLYHWYSKSYDDEQKKIVEKIKGDK